MIVSDSRGLGIQSGVVSDVELITGWADRVIHGDSDLADLAVPPTIDAAVDLLPGWYEDWVAFEREAIRQHLMHALESLSLTLLRRGQFDDAIAAAMAAVRIDPLRESSHRALAQIHLAEGNVGEALHVFRDYELRARRELGVLPTPQFARLLELQVAKPPL
ncbi:bacterial transcriptional activator domain-containing protein [Leifsonia sp. McL0607]|uniref:bacterial transcriptional activator domain-containing protein n=1 Tax=Leifsonia sp. McL0607 TaxID=3415672 RepID=UPI003CECB5FA